MRDVFVGLAVLACPVGMGVMIWMMGKSMRSGAGKSSAEPPSAAQLREEHRRLGARIERMEHSDSQSLRSAG